MDDDWLFRAKGFALAGSVPYKVKQDLFRQSLEHIPHLHLECFKRVKVLLNERMNALLQTTFGAYTHGGLLEFTQCVDMHSAFSGPR